MMNNYDAVPQESEIGTHRREFVSGIQQCRADSTFSAIHMAHMGYDVSQLDEETLSNCILLMNAIKSSSNRDSKVNYEEIVQYNPEFYGSLMARTLTFYDELMNLWGTSILSYNPYDYYVRKLNSDNFMWIGTVVKNAKLIDGRIATRGNKIDYSIAV